MADHPSLPFDESFLEAAARVYGVPPFGYVVTTDSGHVLALNDTLLNWVGYTRGELRPELRLADLLTPGGRLFYETHLAPILRKEGSVDEVALDFIGKGGIVVPTLISARQVRDRARDSVLNRWTIFNASSRRVYERELVSARNLFETTLSSIGDGVITTDAAARVTLLNRAAAELTGWDPDLAVGRPVEDVLVLSRESTGDSVENPIRQALSGRSAVGVENHTLLLSKDGRQFVIDDTAAPIRDEDGEVFGAVMVFRDVTDRRRAAIALAESEQREKAKAAELAALLDAAPVAMFISRDPECAFMTGNAATYQLLRITPGENVSKFFRDPGPAGFRVFRGGREIPAQELPVQKAAATGSPVRDFDFDVVHPDGTVLNMIGNAVPLLDPNGRTCGAVGAFLDATEVKRNENRLLQAQKLESIGLLAAGIAHDFNNLLTGVIGNVSLAVNDVSPENATLLRGALDAAERAAMLTRQLLAYSGKGQFVISDIDVSKAVFEIAELIELSIPKSVRLTVNTQRRLPFVRMDPAQFQQLIMNLIINAGEAVGEGVPGRVSITIAAERVATPFLGTTGDEIGAGWYVAIEVADTGSGIEPATLAKIFDPFFTTKFTGRGLGLAAAAGILRAQKGGVIVKSTPGKGSVFRVYLPVAESAGLDVETPQAEAAGEPAVLVADDESHVRNFLALVLRRQGRRVLTAADGNEAMAIFERENVTMVVLDLMMPGEGADELLPRMKKQRPDLRVLLTSGYSESHARRLCADYPDAKFIQKPYTAERLGKTLQDLLI